MQPKYAATIDGVKLSDLEDHQIFHVYPTFGRHHVTDKRDKCWCRPWVQFCPGGAIINHEAEQ